MTREITLDSRIDSVTVYHSGALVSRVAELVLEAGGSVPTQVEIEGLPLALLDRMVRVRIEQVEPPEARLWTSDVRVGLHAAPRSSGESEVDRKRLDEVERELLTRRQERSQLELERAYLAMMNVPERPRGEEGKPPPVSPISARVVLESFVDEATSERIDAARTLRRQLEELEEEAALLRERLQRASSAKEAKPHELSKTIIARLVTEGATPRRARLRVDYHIPGARWAPAYQCRLSRDCQSAEIALRALVAQRSGEDWRGVKLRLSTASPLSWTELPELSSIRIGRAQPPPADRRGFRPPPRGASMLFFDHDRDRRQADELLPVLTPWRAPALQVAAPDPLPTVDELDDLFEAPSGAAAPEVLDALEADEVEEEAFGAGVSMGSFTTEMAPAPPPAPMMEVSAPAPAAPRRLAAMRGRRRPSSHLTREVQALGDDGPGTEAGASSLLFSQLRLGEPQDAGARARLLPVDTRAIYLETLTRTGADVHVDVLNVVNRAQQDAADVAALPLPESAVDVRRAAAAFDYAYLADALVDVDSDGTFHSVALGTRQAESDVTYVVVPREDASAYRVASLKNPLDAPLLPGPAEVHVGGDYVLTTTLPQVAPRGEFVLGLGVEQAIKVARNAHFEETRSGSKVVAMTELRHRLEIELSNQLARPVRCEVRERIPQPLEDAEVVVEEEQVDPPWQLYDQTDRQRELHGGRRWAIEIAAGAKQLLRAGYVVKIYANNELVGGNRREA